MFQRKEEWLIDEDGYAVEVLIDRDMEVQPIIKIRQDSDLIYLSVEAARQLVGAIVDALPIAEPAPTKRAA